LVKKALLGALAVCVLFVAIGVLWIIANRNDIPQADDSDLLLPDVADNENAHRELMAAIESMSLAEEDVDRFWELAHGKRWDAELASRLLLDENNITALVHLEKAFEKPSLGFDDSPQSQL